MVTQSTTSAQCILTHSFIHSLTHSLTFKDEKVMVFFATCVSVSYFSTLTKRYAMYAPNVSTLTMLWCVCVAWHRLTGLEPVFALHGRMHKKRAGIFNKFMKSKR